MKKGKFTHWYLVFSIIMVFLAFALVAAPTQSAGAARNNQDVAETCKGCHEQSATLWTASKHSTGNVNCLVCHKLGLGDGVHPQTKYTVENEETTCLVCHTEVAGTNIAGQMKLSQHGKAGLKCISCHEPQSQGPVLSPGSKIVCENCHKDQMTGALKSTHTAAGLNCINCHMGPESSHTLKIAGETCGDCHADIHEANRIVTAGIQIQPITTPMAVAEKPAEPEAEVVSKGSQGINLPPWVLLVAGLLFGGIGSWALFGKDPGSPNAE